MSILTARSTPERDSYHSVFTRQLKLQDIFAKFSADPVSRSATFGIISPNMVSTSNQTSLRNPIDEFVYPE
jgi:hypothetical protein